MTIKKKKKTVKKKSKIIVPNDGNKETLHAFRGDAELTQLLNQLDNKSEFIVKALWEAFKGGQYITCPKCKGVGVIKR